MSFWTRHQIFEKNSIVLIGGILAVIAIGGLVEITPLFYLKSTIEVVDGVRPYTPLELTGRNVYVREGCYLCHSQMVRPLRDEVERYGHYSLAAESMRRRTRAVAGNLAALKAETATKLIGAGEISEVPIAAVQAGDIVLLRPGERSAVDGSVIEGQSKIDQSLITGETLPVKAGPGTAVYAGTLNLSGALRVRVTAASESTLLAEISRLLENAVQARSRYVQLADRAARLYAPVVHATALLTMLHRSVFAWFVSTLFLADEER